MNSLRGPFQIIRADLRAYLLIPQLVEVAFKLPPVAARFGTFVSPVSLPAWLNSLLGIGSGLAGIERALRLRHNRFLDTVG
jgi:hypothetical protein